MEHGSSPTNYPGRTPIQIVGRLLFSVIILAADRTRTSNQIFKESGSSPTSPPRRTYSSLASVSAETTSIGLYLIDHDHIDLAGPYIIEKSLQRRPVDIAAGESSISIFAWDQGPIGMGLAADIGLRGIVLGIERIEVLFEPLVIRHAGVDGAANAFWGGGRHCVRPFAGLSRNPKNLG